MSEQYVDFSAQTTVASGGYTLGSGVLNVASTASPFPASGTFRVVIQDATTNVTKVLLIVTGVNSGTQWAVEAEGTDADADATDNVYAVLSAGALQALAANINQFGTYADLPSTAPPAGYRYKCTDSPYDFISSGSVWQAFWNGFPATRPPVSTDWSFEGQTGAGVSTVGGVLQILGAWISSSTEYFNGAYMAAPSTPYSFVARMTMDSLGIIGFLNDNASPGGSNTVSGALGAGIGWRDSGGKYATIGWLSNGGSTSGLFISYVDAFNNLTGSNPVSFVGGNLLIGAGLLSYREWWFKIRNDGTSLYFFISIDGQNWFQVFSAATTAFLANADNVVVYSYGHNASPTVRLMDWTQGTS